MAVERSRPEAALRSPDNDTAAAVPKVLAHDCVRPDARKTTLMRILIGVIRPGCGSIRIGGRPLLGKERQFIEHPELQDFSRIPGRVWNADGLGGGPPHGFA